MVDERQKEWSEYVSVRQSILLRWREAFLGILRHALINVLRRRGATLSSTVGVLLAITFISGTFIAIDSSTRATLEAHTEGVSGDFSFTAGPGDYAEIRDIVSSVPGVTEVVVNEEERQEVPLSRVTQSLVAFLRFEAAFSVLVLTAGLGLVLYAASLERSLEMAGIAVRGAGSRVLAGLLWGEVFVIVLIGVLVGVGTGLAGGYLATQTFLVGPPGTETLAPFLLVVPLEVLWFSLLAFAAMSLSALVMAWRVSRTNWARVLKLRAR